MQNKVSTLGVCPCLVLDERNHLHLHFRQPLLVEYFFDLPPATNGLEYRNYRLLQGWWYKEAGKGWLILQWSNRANKPAPPRHCQDPDCGYDGPGDWSDRDDPKNKREKHTCQSSEKQEFIRLCQLYVN